MALPRSQLSKYSNDLLPTDENDAKAIESFYENYYSEIDDHFDFGGRDGTTSAAHKSYKSKR